MKTPEPEPLPPQVVGGSSVDVDTLVVFATNRGPGIAWDVANSVLWSCERSAHVVIVDDADDVAEVGRHGDVTVMPSKLASRKELSGFKTNEGIQLAIADGMQFKRIWVVDDDVLVLRQGMDTWAADTMQMANIDLLGVADRVNYQEQWSKGYKFFCEAGASKLVAAYYPKSESVFYAVNFMSRRLAMAMYTSNLLVPVGYENWPLWPDVYVSWVADMLSATTTTWGHMDRPKAPIYADHPRHQRMGGPEPRILSADFKIFHSAKAVRGYSELELRQHYRDVRAATGWQPRVAN